MRQSVGQGLGQRRQRHGQASVAVRRVAVQDRRVDQGVEAERMASFQVVAHDFSREDGATDRDERHRQLTKRVRVQSDWMA